MEESRLQRLLQLHCTISVVEQPSRMVGWWYVLVWIFIQSWSWSWIIELYKNMPKCSINSVRNVTALIAIGIDLHASASREHATLWWHVNLWSLILISILSVQISAICSDACCIFNLYMCVSVIRYHSLDQNDKLIIIFYYKRKQFLYMAKYVKKNTN
jgi:hypothetical protein